MIQIDLFSLFLQIVSVLVFMVILNRVLIKPVMSVAEERSTTLEGDEQGAATMLAEARAKREELARKQQEARDTVAAELRKATETASQEAEATKAETSKRTEMQIEEALSSVRKDVEQARPELEKQAGELAEMMERKLVG